MKLAAIDHDEQTLALGSIDDSFLTDPVENRHPQISFWPFRALTLRSVIVGLCPPRR
jgi:hypothetical protein